MKKSERLFVELLTKFESSEITDENIQECIGIIDDELRKHAIKFAKHFHNTTHFIVDEQAFERDYTVWIKNKEQPTPSGE